MSIEDILDAATKAQGGEWAVRKTVDETGDYPFPTYEVIAIFPYGPEGIASAYQNPYNAILFAGAKILAEKVSEYKTEIMKLRADLTAKEDTK
jgi:hypothetical protein